MRLSEEQSAGVALRGYKLGEAMRFLGESRCCDCDWGLLWVRFEECAGTINSATVFTPKEAGFLVLKLILIPKQNLDLQGLSELRSRPPDKVQLERKV